MIDIKQTNKQIKCDKFFICRKTNVTFYYYITHFLNITFKYIFLHIIYINKCPLYHCLT